jgi:hypothetical protein
MILNYFGGDDLEVDQISDFDRPEIFGLSADERPMSALP